ncbi:MAG TPA: D-aminoacyl-tRNA deacylase [Vicinamibacterales bacterium]|nr:D-aminoacyl-tRNA deacylase [Vicinamibacterales bacterium]
MRSVIQRVSSASVSVDSQVVAQIGRGLLVLVGVAEGDAAADIDYTAAKVRELRIFPDDEGRMNRSVVEVGGSVLVVSQFTLLGDVRRGRRPGFDAAASPDLAKTLYDQLVERLRSDGLPIATGVFQAHMAVALVNDGPVTILIDSKKLF